VVAVKGNIYIFVLAVNGLGGKRKGQFWQKTVTHICRYV